MADSRVRNKRTILLAVDTSQHSSRAFNFTEETKQDEMQSFPSLQRRHLTSSQQSARPSEGPAVKETSSPSLQDLGDDTGMNPVPFISVTSREPIVPKILSNKRPETIEAVQELGYAEQLHQENDLLLIIHVVQPPQTVGVPNAGLVVESMVRECRQIEARAVSLLNRFDKKCRDQNFNFELLKDTGQPGEVICKVGQQRNVDLIIVGSRGQGQLRRTFLGSISDYIVHHANIPVGVVPPPLKHDAP